MSDKTTVETEKEVIDLGTELVEFVEIDDTFVNRLESRVGAYKKLILTAYKLTSEPDWVNQSGKFYLQASGCEKIKNPFGISWEKISKRKEDREDEKGRYYIYFFQGTFFSKLLGSRIEVIGKRSSRSAFFGKKGGEILPLSEIDEEDVAMAAMSNMIVNGVSRLIGIRNPSEEQLKAAGLDLTKVQTVKYEGEVSKEESGKGEEAWKMLLELNEGDPEKARALCLELSSFYSKRDKKTIPGKKDPRDLSGKWLESTLQKVKELHGKRFGDQSVVKPQNGQKKGSGLASGETSTPKGPIDEVPPTKEENAFMDLKAHLGTLSTKAEVEQWWGALKTTLNTLPPNLVNNLIFLKEQRLKEVK